MSDNIFHTQLDLETLADALTPLIAERLGDRSSRVVDKDHYRNVAGPPDAQPDAAPEDPWADDTPAEPAKPARGSGGRQKAAQSGRKTVTDDRGKKWTFGIPGAPECEHGEPAAEVSAVKNGKRWKAWACAKGYGDDWRDKCDLFDFH